MASVDVVWKGNCRDPRIRYRLLGYLHRLASLSDNYMRQGERPFALSLVRNEPGRHHPHRANVETVDQTLSGRILISSDIGPHPETLITRAREAGLTVVEGQGTPLIALDEVRLRGLDFKLFDPRGRYPDADRMSFVFLESPDYHFLDGRLVEIDSSGDDDTVLLCSPSIHLRAYLEDWTDCLFSWIRFFVVGDFWWQRREELQGYADYRSVFETLQTERGSAAAEEATFDAVLNTFSQHAEHGIGEVQQLVKTENL